jgi:stearoyl-CoA desaturase (delta-9 desaturase)
MTNDSLTSRPAVSGTPGRWSKGYEWGTIFWVGLLHLGALAAPFFFTWKGLFLLVALGWITGCIGICLGYHRLLTHGSFETIRPLRWLIGTLGALAGEGPPITWVSVHRKHHVFSDQKEDPHSPRDGAWWSHIIWMMPRTPTPELKQLHQRYAPDLLKDPLMRLLGVLFIPLHFAAGTALFLAGWLGWDLYTGFSFLAWGMFLRLVYVLHITWFVNSATHMWGYRNYETTDDSRNLWWVGLLAYGEGWHNNHHAFQRSARHGHRWWEVDMTYWLIRLMQALGLAWNVSRVDSRRVKAVAATAKSRMLEEEQLEEIASTAPQLREAVLTHSAYAESGSTVSV